MVPMVVVVGLVATAFFRFKVDKIRTRVVDMITWFLSVPLLVRSGVHCSIVLPIECMYNWNWCTSSHIPPNTNSCSCLRGCVHRYRQGLLNQCGYGYSWRRRPSSTRQLFKRVALMSPNAPVVISETCFSVSLGCFWSLDFCLAWRRIMKSDNRCYLGVWDSGISGVLCTP